MRDYGVIHRGFWVNEEIRSAGDDARTLAAYLLTSPHTTALGAFRLPDAYACDDLGWTSERLRNGFEALSRIGFIRYDSATRWVWVVKFLEWNKPANPNIWKAVARMANGVPDAVPFKDEILASAGVSETVSKPLGNTPSSSSFSSLSLEGGVGETDLAIPLADGSDYVVPLASVAEWEQAYPRIDVVAELRKARAWCIANPRQRKTRAGVSKFLNGWLSRASERVTPPPAAPSKASLPGGGRREL